MKNIFKYLLLNVILFLAFISTGYTQISKIVIGVDGFTCSLCAKGVEGQFKSLDFVKSVKTDLKNTEFTLYFKNNAKVNVSKISEAVYDGGFSVRDIKIDATGSITGNAGSGYNFTTPDMNSISLKDVSGKFNDGDKVTLKGKVSSDISHINVTSIKKL